MSALLRRPPAEKRILEACLLSLKQKYQKKATAIKASYTGRKNYMMKGKAHKKRFADLRMDIQILREQYKQDLIRMLDLDPEWVEAYLKQNFKHCHKNRRYKK